MTDILYYSNYCNHSKKIIQTLSKTQLKDKMHFICIDNRVKEGDKIYIVLQNGKKIIMPDNIVKVPAMINLTTYNILYGDDIYDYVNPKTQQINNEATMNNMEPMAFSLGVGTMTGVASDNFSFLDMTSDSLSAQGDGGLRQMYNYASVDYHTAISTPSEEFGSRKNNMSLEQLQKQRDMDVRH